MPVALRIYRSSAKHEIKRPIPQLLTVVAESNRISVPRGIPFRFKLVEAHCFQEHPDVGQVMVHDGDDPRAVVLREIELCDGASVLVPNCVQDFLRGVYELKRNEVLHLKI